MYYRIKDIYNSTSVVATLDFLEKSQWWPLRSLREFQNKRLRCLIHHAYENVPYYHRYFDEKGLCPGDIQTTGDLQKLPLITKQTVRDNFNEFISADINNRGARLVSTSGSSGEPFKYYRDLEHRTWTIASKIRGMRWAGYEIGDRLAILGGSSIIQWQKTSFKEKCSLYVERILTLPVLRVNKDIFSNYLKLINRFKPAFVRSYPTSIYLFSQFIEEREPLQVYPKAVITTAELLLPEYKELIEKVFKCNVFNEYGSNDGGLLSFECSEHSGFHYTCEKCIVEILDDGRPAQPGEAGEVVLTDLCNYSMPLIRYKNGDSAILSNSLCRCQRGLPIIKSVEGRTGDFLTFANGIVLGMVGLTLIFRKFNFRNYQVRKKSENHLEILVVKGSEYQQGDEAELLRIMKAHLSSEIKVQIRFVETIELTSAGKRKFFIDETK